MRAIPGASGVLTIDARGSDFDTVLGVYTGSSVGDLALEGCNDDWEDLQSFVEVEVIAGMTYHIQLGGYEGESGSYQLQVALDTSRTSVPSPTPSPTLIPTATPTETASPTPTPTLLFSGTATLGPGGLSAGLTRAGANGPGVPISGQGSEVAAAARGSSSAVVSAAAPSVTEFVLPNGQAINLALDAQAIENLRAIAPTVGSIRLSLDPAPVLNDQTMEGALGGGNVRPHASPVRLRIDVLDHAGDVMLLPGPYGPQALGGDPAAATAATAATARGSTEATGASASQGVLGILSAWQSLEVSLSLPVMTQPAEPGHVFAWLHGVYARGRFLGYARPDARFDPFTGSLRLRLPLGDLQAVPEGTLFLPVILQPAWVQSFVPDLHIYSGPTDGALDYGPAGPQFTVYTVVGPQVAGRLFVFNPAAQNYGWIDASGVGPSGPPG